MKYIKLFEEYYNNHPNSGYDMSYEIDKNGDEINIYGYLDDDDLEERELVGTVSVNILTNDVLYEYELKDDLDYDTFNGVFKNDIIVKIEHINIIDEFRGCDYGKMIMDYTMSYLKKEGYTNYYLNASPMGYDGLNQDNLVKFYKSFGFKELLKQYNNTLMYI